MIYNYDSWITINRPRCTVEALIFFSGTNCAFMLRAAMLDKIIEFTRPCVRRVTPVLMIGGIDAYIIAITTIGSRLQLSSVHPARLPRRRTRFPVGGGWFSAGRVLAIHDPASVLDQVARETSQIPGRFTSACSHKYPERQWRDFAFKHAAPGAAGMCGEERTTNEVQLSFACSPSRPSVLAARFRPARDRTDFRDGA